MHKTYGKNTRRTIKGTFGRFAAIFAIVALGVGFLTGLLSSTPDMRISFDSYFDKTSMYDIRVLGDMGLTSRDIDTLKGLDGVSKVQAGYIADVLITSSRGTDYATRMLSCNFSDDSAINRPILTSGRLPQSANECVIVNVPLGSKEKFQTGDTFDISESSKNANDLMNTKEYTVVGFVDYSPYFSAEKESTNIGSGTIDLFMLAPIDSFKNDIYTDIYITVSGTRELLSMSDGYNSAVDKVASEIKDISGVRSETRYNEVRSEAEKKLSDAKSELDNSKSEVSSKLADAQNQITENEAQLNKSESQLIAQEKLAKAEFADADKKLGESQQAIDLNNASLQKQWANASTELSSHSLTPVQQTAFNSIQKLSVEYPALSNELAELSKDSARLGEIEARLKQIGSMSQSEQATHAYEVATLTQEAYALEAEVQKMTSSPDYAAYSSAVSALTSVGGDSSLLAPLALKLGALDTAQNQIRSGQSQLNAQRSALKSKEASTAKQFASAHKKISDGRAKIESAKNKYNDSNAEAENEIADGEQKIADAQAKISNLKAPEWHVYTRDDSISYTSIKANIDKVNAIAKVFPFFFFLVAALVASTTMTRMIEDERLQIGTLKALGYSQSAIMGKYVIYALIASISGSVFGILVGYRLFPSVIWNAYNMMYELPGFICPLNWPYALITSFAVTACILFSTMASCRATLREKPAQLMLSKAPKAGKRVLIERVTFIWSRMKFTYKVTARNLFRYKKRFFMTVIGVAGCTALLVTGFGMRDSFNDIADKQFGELCTYNIYAPISDKSALNNSEIQSMLSDSNKVSGSTPIYLENVSLTFNNKDFKVYTFIPENASDLNNFVKFQTIGSHKPISFEEGSVILTQKASEILGVKTGDTVTLTDVDGRKGDFTISGICENYVRNYIYMSEGTFKVGMGHKNECNMLAMSLTDNSPDAQAAFGKELLDTGAVGGVSFTSNSKDAVARALSKIDMIVVVIIISAGALAFVVLYNLININISERIKEIATIKVLGFTEREVNAYINRETMILSLIGTVVGLILGIFLHKYVMGQAEMDSIIFGRTVKAMSFVYSAVLTMVFSIFVDLILRRKLYKISMVESMKAPE